MIGVWINSYRTATFQRRRPLRRLRRSCKRKQQTGTYHQDAGKTINH